MIMDYWHWWIVAVILFIVEMIAPTTFLIWLGIGAVLTGFINLAMILLQHPLGIEVQGLIFVVFSLISVVIGKKIYKTNSVRSENVTLNRRGEQYIGRVITLSDAVRDGRGHVRIDDTSWSVRGPDCAAQTQVQVINVDGSLLIIEPLV